MASEPRIRPILGCIVGATIWPLSLGLLVHGLWVQAWYGYTFAAIFLAFGTFLLVWHHRLRQWSDAELERLARKYQEEDKLE